MFSHGSSAESLFAKAVQDNVSLVQLNTTIATLLVRLLEGCQCFACQPSALLNMLFCVCLKNAVYYSVFSLATPMLEKLAKR